MPSLAREALDRERARVRSNNGSRTEPSPDSLLERVSNIMEQIRAYGLEEAEVADTSKKSGVLVAERGGGSVEGRDRASD